MMSTEIMPGSESDDIGFSSPTGAALLLIVGEPHSEIHRNLILDEITKGFQCWNRANTDIDINEELSQIAKRASFGDEGPNGERIIRHKSDNIAVEILVNPQTATVRRSLKGLLTIQSPHKFLLYSGHAFQGSGAWVLQDDVFTFANMAHVFKDTDVENALKQNKESRLIIYTLAEHEWRSSFSKHEFAKELTIVVNPPEEMDNVHGILQFAAYIGGFVKSLNVTTMLHSSEIVGNIKFSRPTLYIFPGCQGDSALFGINGFSLLVNGGYSRRSCFWDFTRHLDRIDAFLLTHLGTDNLFGIGSVLQKKQIENVHPEIGFMYLNASEKTRNSPSPSVENVNEKDPSLLINLAEEGNRLIDFSKQLGQLPHPCSRTTSGQNQEPINLYHKVGHGSLDMYILNPVQDSKELKEFYMQWNKQVNNFGVQQHFPLPNMLSICALLVWKPSSPTEKITRIFFPGNAPQNKVIEGLEKIKNLDFLKHPYCCQKDLQQVKKVPSGSRVTATKATVRSAPPVKAESPKRTERAERSKPLTTTTSRVKVVKEDTNKKAATRSKEIKKDKEKEKKEKTDKSKSSTSSSPSKSSVSAHSPSKSLTPTEVPPESVVPQETPEPVMPEPTPKLQETAQEQPLVNHVSETAPVTKSEQISNAVNDVRKSVSPEPLPDPTQFEPSSYDSAQKAESEPYDKQTLAELGVYEDDYEEAETAVSSDLCDLNTNTNTNMSEILHPPVTSPLSPVTSPLSPGEEYLRQPQALPDPVQIAEQAPLSPEKDFMRDGTPDMLLKDQMELDVSNDETSFQKMEKEESPETPVKEKSPEPLMEEEKEELCETVPIIMESPTPKKEDEEKVELLETSPIGEKSPMIEDEKEDSPEGSPIKEQSPVLMMEVEKERSHEAFPDREESPSAKIDVEKDDHVSKEESPAPCYDDVSKEESPVPVYNESEKEKSPAHDGYDDPAEDIPSSPEPTDDPQEFSYPCAPVTKDSDIPFMHEPDVIPAQASIEQSLQYGITDDQTRHMGGIREEEEEEDKHAMHPIEDDHVDEPEATMVGETEMKKPGMEDLGIYEDDQEEMRDSLERDPRAFVYEKEVDLEDEEEPPQEKGISTGFEKQNIDELQLEQDVKEEIKEEKLIDSVSDEAVMDQESVRENNHVESGYTRLVEDSEVDHDFHYEGTTHEMESEQESNIPEAFEKDDTPQPRENQPFDFSTPLNKSDNGTEKLGDHGDDTDSIDGGTPDDDKDIDESFTHVEEMQAMSEPALEMDKDMPANMRAGIDTKNPFDTIDQQGYNPFVGIEDTGCAQPLPANMNTFPIEESEQEKDKAFDPVAEWGQPMGLPSPSPPGENKTDVATPNGVGSNVAGSNVADKSSKLAKTAKNGTTKMADAKKAPTHTKSPEKRPPSATAKAKPTNGQTNKTDLHTRTGRPTTMSTDKKPETKRPTTAGTERKPTPTRTRPATAPASRTADAKTRSSTARRPVAATSRSSPVNSRAAPLPPLTPFYVDLTYIPNHGDSLYSDIEFFKRIRARYYVLSSLSPNPQILNSLLEAKKVWEDKDLDVTVIPTYDNETLRHWMGLHKEDLSQLKIDVAPSASRCTIQLQDHETSCSAYRLEF